MLLPNGVINMISAELKRIARTNTNMREGGAQYERDETRRTGYFKKPYRTGVIYTQSASGDAAKCQSNMNSATELYIPLKEQSY